jgi:hypothetical protein
MWSPAFPARSAAAKLRSVARVGQWLLPFFGALIVSGTIAQAAERALRDSDPPVVACGDQPAISAPVVTLESARTGVVSASSGDVAYVRMK